MKTCKECGALLEGGYPSSCEDENEQRAMLQRLKNFCNTRDCKDCEIQQYCDEIFDIAHCTVFDFDMCENMIMERIRREA